MGLLEATGYHQLPVVEGDHLVDMLNRDHVKQYLQSRRVRSPNDGSGRITDGQPGATSAEPGIGLGWRGQPLEEATTSWLPRSAPTRDGRCWYTA